METRQSLPFSLIHPWSLLPVSISVSTPSSILFSLASLANVTLRAGAAEMDDGDEPGLVLSHNTSSGSKSGGDKMFSLKKWNAVAMWSWDVECDTCAICRVQVMGKFQFYTAVLG